MPAVWSAGIKPAAPCEKKERQDRSCPPDPYTLTTHSRCARVRLIEKARLAFHADDGLGQGTGANTAAGVELTELGNGLLAHAVARADGTDESPVGMRLAILGDCSVTQVHERP